MMNVVIVRDPGMPVAQPIAASQPHITLYLDI